jgi:hypothetical protein
MLQVFHMDVAKVDLDVAHVAMAMHICLKVVQNVSSVSDYVASVLSRFANVCVSMFRLFQTYVAIVLSKCCKIRSGCRCGGSPSPRGPATAAPTTKNLGFDDKLKVS